MNVYAGRLEKQADILIMNRCHALWAVGIMAGSAAVAVSPYGGYGAQLVLCAVAVWGAVVSKLLPRLPGEEVSPVPPRRSFSALPKALLLIAGFMFIVTLTEGIMADWSAVYLAERLNNPDAHAGIAVTIFSARMSSGG